MTKQQKARAHLARAQELLSQDTLAFGGVSDLLDWFKVTLGTKKEGSLMKEITPNHLLVETARDLNGQDLLNFRKLGRAYRDAVSTLMKERTKGDQGDKNLMNALEKRDMIMVNMLFQNGARMKKPLDLLMYAIENDLTDLASKIITTQLSTSPVDTGKVHIDHYICDSCEEFTYHTALMYAITYHYICDSCEEFKYHTALMYAITYKRYSIARLLLDHGADVNGHYFAVNGGDSTDSTIDIIITPLDTACMTLLQHRKGDYEYAHTLSFVRYLLEKGANPSMMGRYRYLIDQNPQDVLPHHYNLTAILHQDPLQLLRYAIRFDQTDLAHAIITSRLSTSPVDTGKVHIDQLICDSSTMITIKHYTALMYAITFNRFSIARLLVEQGADVNGHYSAVNGGNQPPAPTQLKTPLDVACLSADMCEDDEYAHALSFVRYLLEKGANPSMMGKYKYLLDKDQTKPRKHDLSALLRSYTGY